MNCDICSRENNFATEAIELTYLGRTERIFMCLICWGDLDDHQRDPEAVRITDLIGVIKRREFARQTKLEEEMSGAQKD